MQYNYNLIKSLNIPIQTSVIGSKNNKEYHNYDVSNAGHNTHNALYISTGESHGGYIGLRFKNRSSYIVFCLETINILPHTLTSTTPELGYHYMFKLNRSQQKCLSDYSSGTLKLFGHEVDVIYNYGQMIMYGQYNKICPVFGNDTLCYTIVDPVKPAKMPNIIFDEIMRCANSLVDDNVDLMEDEYDDDDMTVTDEPVKKDNKWKLIERLRKLSKPFDDISELWNQWNIVSCYMASTKLRDKKGKKLKDWNTHNFHNEDKYIHNICLCSHSPIYSHNYVENILTNQRCIIGSCCIKKFGTDKLKQTMRVKLGELQGFKYCVSCKVQLDKARKYIRPYHDTCYKKILASLKCTSCNNTMTNRTRIKVEGKYFHQNCYDMFLDNRRCTMCTKRLPYRYKINQIDHKECLNPDLIRYCRICDKKLPYHYTKRQVAHELCLNRTCTVCDETLPSHYKINQFQHNDCLNRTCIVCNKILSTQYKIYQKMHDSCVDRSYTIGRFIHKACPNRKCELCDKLLPSHFNMYQVAHDECLYRKCTICDEILPSYCKIDQKAHDLCLNLPQYNCNVCDKPLPNDYPRSIKCHKECSIENIAPPAIITHRSFINPYTGEQKF